MVTEPHAVLEKHERGAPRHPSFGPAATAKRFSAAADPESVLRIAPGDDGVSIWSAELFGDRDKAQLRKFLSRVFSVEEVAAVEILRAEAFGRVHYESSGTGPEIWRKLARALQPHRAARSNNGRPVDEANDGKAPDAGNLFLDGPDASRIFVHRVGSALSTWRVRYRDSGEMRLTHPVLRNRRDVAYRLEEVLAAIAGVDGFATNTLTASVTIRFNPQILNAERLLRQLEKCWPQLLEGLAGPPSVKRLIAAGGLLGLAITGQYLVPRLRPLAVLGVTLYGSHNVAKGAKELARLRVGLPALYSVGLAFSIWTGMPFSSALMAVLMQLWPQLAHRTVTGSQRRLFAVHRQRATWARLIRDDGLETEVDIDAVRPGDLIAIRKGETAPVDGLVTAGLAAVDEEALSGVAGAIDKTPGDRVYAATVVRDGTLNVRVEKIGAESIAGYIGAHLPHGNVDNLPSAAEVERIANRNAKAALALAGVNLAGRRLLRPSQAIIRPDYVTGPRLSAQLAVLHDLGEGINRGIFFRDPTALDRLPATDIYVFDDASGLAQQPVEVADVISAGAVAAETVLGYATAAFPLSQNERARALAGRSVRQEVSIPEISHRQRRAGAICYRDREDRQVEVAISAHINNSNVDIPSSVTDAVAASGAANGSGGYIEFFLRPLWIVRDGELLGAITFRRHGEPEGAEVIGALQARNKRSRFVYISSAAQAAAEALARQIGISTVFGGLDKEGKARALNRLGCRTMWIGNGASPEAIPSIEASAVSISIAGASTAPSDAADIVFLQPGLQNLLPLRRIAHSHHARIGADYRVVYAANLAGVAGGFFAGFGSLEAGLISNFGTGYVYARRLKQIYDLVSQTEERRAKFRSPTQEESDTGLELLHTGTHEPEEFVQSPPVGDPTRPASDLNAV
jgi:manganese/zinc-transporting P-type ATPase C